MLLLPVNQVLTLLAVLKILLGVLKYHGWRQYPPVLSSIPSAAVNLENLSVGCMP